MFSINCLEITVPQNTWKENKSLYKNLVTKNDYLLFLKKHRTMAGFKKKILYAIKKNPYITNEELTRIIGNITIDGIRNHITKMKKANIIVRRNGKKKILGNT